MAAIIDLKTCTDPWGDVTVIEKVPLFRATLIPEMISIRRSKR
jgi:hypothetical protein